MRLRRQIVALLSVGVVSCGAPPPEVKAPAAPAEVPILGGPIEIVADLPDVPECDNIVMDGDGILFSAPGRGVVRVAKKGGEPKVVLERPAWPFAVDDDAIYAATWRWGPKDEGATGDLLRVEKAGGGVTVLASRQRPGSAAIDGEHVYWVSLADHEGLRGVLRTRKTGGPLEVVAAAPAAPVSVVTGTSGGWMTTGELVLDEAHAYFLAAERAQWTHWLLLQAPKDGSAPPHPIYESARGVSVEHIASDGASIYLRYWSMPTNFGRQYLERVPLPGGDHGAGTLPAVGLGLFAIDAYAAYTNDSGPILATPKRGGAHTLATGQRQWTSVATDATHLYWTRAGPRCVVARLRKW